MEEISQEVAIGRIIDKLNENKFGDMTIKFHSTNNYTDGACVSLSFSTGIKYDLNFYDMIKSLAELDYKNKNKYNKITSDSTVLKFYKGNEYLCSYSFRHTQEFLDTMQDSLAIKK